RRQLAGEGPHRTRPGTDPHVSERATEAACRTRRELPVEATVLDLRSRTVEATVHGHLAREGAVEATGLGDLGAQCHATQGEGNHGQDGCDLLGHAGIPLVVSFGSAWAVGARPMSGPSQPGSLRCAV